MGMDTCLNKVIKPKDYDPKDDCYAFLVSNLVKTKNGIGFLNHFKDYVFEYRDEVLDIAGLLRDHGYNEQEIATAYIYTHFPDGKIGIRIPDVKDEDREYVDKIDPSILTVDYVEDLVIAYRRDDSPYKGLRDAWYIQKNQWGNFTKLKEYKDYSNLYYAFIYSDAMLQEILPYNQDKDSRLWKLKLKKNQFITIDS